MAVVAGASMRHYLDKMTDIGVLTASMAGLFPLDIKSGLGENY